MSLQSLLQPDRVWMQMAYREAEKAFDANEVPVGAVIVKNGEVLGKGYNLVETLKDPTAHAEMIAITAACEKLGSKRLNGCTLYVTLEPCPMCAGGLVWSQISRIVYGAMDEKAGCCGSLYNLVQDGKLNHQIEVVAGIMESESANLLRTFFSARRRG